MIGDIICNIIMYATCVHNIMFLSSTVMDPLALLIITETAAIRIIKHGGENKPLSEVGGNLHGMVFILGLY